MKLLKLALLCPAAFSNLVHATRNADRIPYFPRQVVAFNTTTATASASSSPQGDHSSPSVNPAATSQHATDPGSQVPGDTLSVTGGSGTGGSFSTTSDEIGSQISNTASTARPSNGTFQSTVNLTTPELPGTSSRALTTTVTFVSANVPSTSTFSRIGNVSISALSSGNYSRFPTSVSGSVDGNQQRTSTVTVEWPSETGNYEPNFSCVSTSDGAIPTTWSIVYTSTTTFFGNPTEYIPPHPEITIPTICASAALATVGEKSRASAPGGESCTLMKGVEVCTARMAVPSILVTMVSMSSIRMGPETTYTFVTTAKNPSVVYSPVSTPRYGQSSETGPPQDKYMSVKAAPNPQSPINDQGPPGSPPAARESAKQTPTTTYKITAAPTKIIINEQTFRQDSPSETKEVTVSGVEFTINPSEVVGGGTTVDRPGNVGRSTMVSSSTVVEGLPVVIAPAGTQNAVVIGGTTFEVLATPVTAVVQSQTVTIQPSSIVVQKQTISISRASPIQTEIVVAGGEMITAIGPSVVVIRSTTFTYGPASSTITETVGDDTILIAPSGVVVRGMTIGGPTAKASVTAYEIVGGATVTQVGASVVVVDGTSFTVGPGKGTTTKVFGGETITIGPSGVVISTVNLPYPFGPTVITTIDVPSTAPTPAPAPPAPSETRSSSAGVRHARRTTGMHLEFCIAIGVWVLGLMV